MQNKYSENTEIPPSLNSRVGGRCRGWKRGSKKSRMEPKEAIWREGKRKKEKKRERQREGQRRERRERNKLSKKRTNWTTWNRLFVTFFHIRFIGVLLQNRQNKPQTWIECRGKNGDDNMQCNALDSCYLFKLKLCYTWAYLNGDWKSRQGLYDTHSYA